MIGELFSLRGRGALVTGAARGLGEAMALALAEAGADVAAVDVQPLDAATTAIAEHGVRCAGRRADLSALTPQTAAELLTWARAELGDVSVLVNNAGMIRRAPAVETAADDWDAVIALNLTAPFLLAQAFARPLLAQGGRGSIVNVVSMNSFHGGMHVPAYTASKHGLLGLTRALANEWTGQGIRVNGRSASGPSTRRWISGPWLSDMPIAPDPRGGCQGRAARAGRRECLMPQGSHPCTTKRGELTRVTALVAAGADPVSARPRGA